MNERTALVLSSAIAAWCVANAAIVFGKAMRWVRPDDFEFATVQARVALPAVLAVAASVWWCTDRGAFRRGEHLSAAVAITAFSYLALAPCTAFCMVLFGLIEGSIDSENYAKFLQGAVISGVIVVIPAVIITALPAFGIEYLVVRFVRGHFDAVAKKEAFV